MSGVHGQVLGHLVKRGVEAAQAHFSAPKNEYMQQLQHDAEAYDKAGPEMEVQFWELLPVIITGVVTMLLLASIRYTIGEVMASLTMIESQTSTAIIEDKPPAYADEPNAPLDKESLLPAEAEADVEVTLIRNKPITSKISTTIGLLHKVGGWRARWRGLGMSLVYHFVHGTFTNIISAALGLGLLGHALVSIWASVCLARVHLVWTHAMIAQPSTESFWRRLVPIPRKQVKAILLPSFVFAVAQQATWILPVAVAFMVGLPNVQHEHVIQAAQQKDCHMLGLLGLRFLAVPATGLFVAFMILLPASVTLTRIEALLLPETHDTIVPFDRQAIIGDIDLSACGSSRQLFVNAWRSFDRASRWRLIKLYVKMVFIQLAVVLTAVHLMAAELYVIGGDRLSVLAKSAAAQIKLMAIEAQENQAPN
ncbi:hypothetical protein DOTSEDRAFT_70537 [Dothistroma septosporum NZE10]|uniref:Uncharacterized protein n=1 Tax=Dothistroma septosporum (strain NZE10 / CBS 128990) TaxID=675120 RepID=N1PSX0_DOTSN|nr:hypothetical protein DOTSEDRAFT_70537 [Dothistroma septosporum NZE10]